MFVAPPVVSVPAPPPLPGSPRVDILSFAPATLTCAGEPVASVHLIRPMSVVVTRYGPDDRGPPPGYRLAFAIDPAGYAHAIRRDGPTPSGFYADTSDLAPALAASRFAPGAERTGCTVTYRATLAPIEQAPMQDLYALASRPEPTNLPPAVYDRVRPAGSDCRGAPGQYRQLNLPAFEKLPPVPGGSAWSYLTFDVDARGKPTGVRVLGSSGDPALDEAGVKALRANRYAPGPGYRGCTYHFYQNDPVDRPAPVLPAEVPADNADQAGCTVDPTSIPFLLNGGAFPRPFAHRRIEGIAVIGFDTAPWGALGNVRVLASEPDESFGDAARNALSTARVPESATGRRGCVQRVRFKLPPRAGAR